MSLSRIELEQIQANREFLDQYTAAESAALAESAEIDLQGVQNHVFSAIKRILAGDASGVGNWYDVPAASLTELAQASGDLQVDIGQINSFIGRTEGESSPTYASTNFVTQNGDLEQAIGELDAQLAFAVAGSGGNWQTHYNSGSGLLTIDGLTNPDAQISLVGDGRWIFGVNNPGADAVFSASGAQIRELGFRPFEVVTAEYSPGDTVTIPDTLTYTPSADGINLRVYHNGQLLLPGSGVTATDENYNDYREVDSTSIVTNVKLKTDAVLQFHING